MVSSSGAQAIMEREYEWSDVSPCVAVIDAIARFEGIETHRMSDNLPALHEAVDTDAVDSLITNSSPVSITFPYAGYYVQLMDETVSISQLPRLIIQTA